MEPIQRHRESENSRNQLIVLFKIRIPNKKKMQKHDKNDRRKRFEQYLNGFSSKYKLCWITGTVISVI